MPPRAPTSEQHTRLLAVIGLVALLGGCSSVADDLEDAEGADSGAADGTDGGLSEGDGDGAPPPGTEPPEPGQTTGDDDDNDDGGGAGPMVKSSGGACPDSWPAAWLFCEDFEELTDPVKAFSEYASADGAFVIDRPLGAMRADYREGEEEAGWVLVAFGDSPIDHGGTTYAPQEHFEEIYWRVNVLHQPGWPDVGPGWLSRATAFASDGWAEALVGHVRSHGKETTLEAAALTCVRDELVECDVYNDQTAFEPLEPVAGSTKVASSQRAGQWQCIEGHIKLNTLAAQDGVFEFWVDDHLENARTDLDWRGKWDGYGLNAITLHNFWPGGAPGDVSRWMDDIVVSTERIGCDL